MDNQLTEQQVRAIIQDELNKYSVKNMFGISNIPAHPHDGVSGQQIDGNNLAFALSYFRLPTSTAVPTSTPSTGAVTVVGGILYIYDGSAWSKVSPTTSYAGFVNSGGTVGNLPSGWTSAKNSTGQYTITHNLGSANYAVIAMCNTGGKEIISQSIATNTFDIWTFNGSGTGSDSSFNFILTLF